MRHKLLEILSHFLVIILLGLLLLSLIKRDILYSGIMFFGLGFINYTKDTSDNKVSRILNCYHLDFVIGTILILASVICS